jgi:hypothetical protein
MYQSNATLKYGSEDSSKTETPSYEGKALRIQSPSSAGDSHTQRVNIISRGLVVTLYLGLRRFIFHSGYLLVGIWEVYGGTNRLPLAEGDALKYVTETASMTVAVSVRGIYEAPPIGE